MKNTGRLRHRSKRTAAIYRNDRYPLVAEFLEERPWCEFPEGCDQRSTSVHEVLSRSQGGSILDRSNLRAACWPHNQWAEDNPLAAHKLGWKIMRKAA